MPIVNLTDNGEGKGLPRIAKLHKGDKKTDPNRPGKDLDYFRVVFEPEFEQFRPVWEELYGDEPDAFEQVFMTHATVDAAFDSWKEEWNASQTLLHRCDGENQIAWYNTSANMYMSAKTTCAMKTDTPCGCKAVGRLNLIIPEFIGVTGILGYVMVETHSLNDILTVYSMLANIQRINGTLLGIPFSLGRSGKQISAPNKKSGTRIKVTKSLFYLYPDPVFTKETLLPRLAAAGGFLSAEQPLLPAPEQPKLDSESIRSKLGTGDGQRRIGAPDETSVVNPTPELIPPPAPPPPPVITPAATLQPQTVGGTVTGIDTVGNALGQLKTRALKEVFNGNTKAMNKCISELIGLGKLPPVTPLEEALEIIKKANCAEAVAETKDETITDIDFLADGKVVQPTLDGMPRKQVAS